MSCCCEGNKDLKNLERIREIAAKAAQMEECVFVVYKRGDVYYFCKEDEEFNGEMIEYVFP